MFNFSQEDSNMSVWFTLDGADYELSQFNILFSQASDEKGEPQGHVRGGRMLLTLTQTLPESLYAWAMKTTAKNGRVVFRIENGSAPLSVEFTNGYCVNFNRVINALGGGVTTTLTISPDEVLINGVSLDNHWVN